MGFWWEALFIYLRMVDIGVLAAFSGLFRLSSAQEGIAIHIVNEITEAVVLFGPQQADGS